MHASGEKKNFPFFFLEARPKDYLNGWQSQWLGNEKEYGMDLGF